MKDVLIGTLSGISAVIAILLLTPRPQLVSVPVRELPLLDTRYGALLDSRYGACRGRL